MSKKVEHTSVAGLRFEPNKKLGYYFVNNEIYYNKYHPVLDDPKLQHDDTRDRFDDIYFLYFA